MNTSSSQDILESWSPEIRKLTDTAIAVAVGIFDEKGLLLYANAGMKLLLDAENTAHHPADYLVNPNFAELIRLPASEHPVFRGLLTAGNGQDISRSMIAEVRRRDDMLFISGEYDVRELDDLNRQMTALNREISNLQRELIKEKKTLEHTLSELRKTQAMLIHSEKMNALGKLVAGIAHEINNPIAYISSNLHSLRNSFSDIMQAYAEIEKLIQNTDNAELNDAAEKIREKHDIAFIFEDFEDLHKASADGVARIIKIVKDLRTFSRLDEGELKPVDLLESIRSTLMLADSELKKRNIAVNLDFADMPLMECYASELNQVFLNLIVNAAQAMEKGGHIDIRGRSENDGIRIEFADAGVGIPEEIIGKIFDPFFTTKPVGSGTGLGLSLAYKIITEKHKGSITVRSKVNEGTVFTIVIPRRQTYVR
jgi:signal transduction histidine kinase